MIENEHTDDVEPRADEVAELRREKAALERSEYERRQAEEALQRSEDKYRRLVEGLRRVCFFFACQPGGEITYVSPSATDILGHEPRQMLGPLADLLVEDSSVNEGAVEEFRRLFSGEHHDPLLLEFRHAHAESRLLELVDVSAREEGGGPRDGIAIDVTERLRAETAILQSSDRFRRLAEALQDEYFFYERGRDGTITRVSSTVRGLLGYEPEEFRDHFDEYLTDNPLNQGARKALQDALSGKPSAPYEVEILDADGRERLLEVCDLPRVDAAGQVTAVDGLARDASERRRIQEALEWQVESDALALRNSARLLDATDDTILADVLESLGHFLEVDRVWLVRRDPDAGLAVTAAWFEEDAGEEQPHEPPFDGPGWSRRRLEAAEPVGIPRVDGLPADAADERAFLESRGVEAALWIPVLQNEELDAVLGIESIRGARGWTDRETRLAQRMAHDLAGASRRLATVREADELRREAFRLQVESDDELDRRTAQVREELTRQLVEARQETERRVEEARAELEAEVQTAREDARVRLNRLREEAEHETVRVRAEAERRRAELEEQADEREERLLAEARERIRRVEEDAEARVREVEEDAETRVREAQEEIESRVREAEEELERVRAESREELHRRIEEARAAAEAAREEAEEQARQAEQEAREAEESARQAEQERDEAERRTGDVDAEVERRVAEVRAELEDEIETTRRDLEEARAAAQEADARARAGLERPLEILDHVREAENGGPAVEIITRHLRRLVAPSTATEPSEEPTEIAVQSLIEELASVLWAWAADRPVEITLLPPGRPVVVEGRRSLLQDALAGLATSLVDDADGGSITLQFDVDDSGPALRVRATTERPATAPDELSSGLVALRERLTSAGGHVDVSSAENDIGAPQEAEAGAPGAMRLEMKLPLEGIGASAEPAGPGELAGRRVLVVDDHHGSRNALARALELQGMEVQTASSGPATLALFRDAAGEHDASPWDLLLIDWDMPGMDGIETTSRIGEHSGLDAPPAVLMGNPAEARDVRRRAELGGFAGALIKPAPGPTLAAALKRALPSISTPTGLAAVEPAPSPTAVGEEPEEDVAGAGTGDDLHPVEPADDDSRTAPVDTATAFLAEEPAPASDTRSGGHRDDIAVIDGGTAVTGDDAPAWIDETPAWIDEQPARIDSKPARMAADPAGFGGSSRPGGSTTPATGVSIHDIPTLDAGAGLGRTGGDEARYREILLQFRDDHREAGAELERALDRGYREAALELARRVGERADEIGATEIQDAAHEVAAALERGRTEELDGPRDAFGRALDRLMDSLAGLEGTTEA